MLAATSWPDAVISVAGLIAAVAIIWIIYK